MSFSNDFQTLLTVAEAYFYLGYSVIPLLGDTDPSRSKVPAISWAKFQQHRASPDDYRQWFAEIGFGGLGIVTGGISQLVVLDFDTVEIFNAFKVQYPDLLETHTVRSASRQLPHLYFQLPPHLHIASQKGQGVDLLSDGRYVVAPPTCINGQSYKISRGGMPKTLTERDTHRLQAFLANHTFNCAKTPPVSLQQPPSTIVVSSAPIKASLQDLSSLYQYFCKQGGRNEALFRTGLYARDTGWRSNETQKRLVPLHIQQSATGFHSNETLSQRQREATNTIQSAFSRPARPIKPQTVHRQGDLSNSVREALMQKGMTYVIRSYEGLLHTGIHPGQIISAKDAVEDLKGVVGRDSVLRALKAGQGSKRFFPPPASPPITANAVASDKPQAVSKECSFEGSKNQYKPQGGRPAHLFRMPTNEELCEILGVKVTGSDPLEQDDLSSAPKTRMALNRELIKRRPGQYGKGWLARRLGVNKRTLATYNRLIPIRSRAMFTETPITWEAIELLPFDESIQGAVLVTSLSKRYPALRTIASRLLANGENLCLKQQTANFYWYGDEELPMTQVTRVIEKLPENQETVKIFSQQAKPKFPERFWKNLEPSHQPVKVAKKTTHKAQNKSLSPRHFQHPLADLAQEALATKVYTALNQLAGKVQFSRANARRVAFTYPAPIIEEALKRMNMPSLAKRTYKPIGFFIMLVRSTARSNNV